MSVAANPWEQRLLEERARALAGQTARELSEPANVERVMVCALGESLFGIDVRDVARVTPFRHPARLPGANVALIGLISTAGAYRRIYDLSALLHGQAGALAGHFLMLRNGAVGLRVDAALEIADVVPLADGETPDMAPHAATRAYARPLKAELFGGRLISLLDIKELLPAALPAAQGGHIRVDL